MVRYINSEDPFSSSYWELVLRFTTVLFFFSLGGQNQWSENGSTYRVGLTSFIPIMQLKVKNFHIQSFFAVSFDIRYLSPDLRFNVTQVKLREGRAAQTTIITSSYKMISQVFPPQRHRFTTICWFPFFFFFKPFPSIGIWEHAIRGD